MPRANGCAASTRCRTLLLRAYADLQRVPVQRGWQQSSPEPRLAQALRLFATGGAIGRKARAIIMGDELWTTREDPELRQND